MHRVDMQVFVVLYSVVGPLLVRGRDIDRAAHEEVNGGLLTQHSQRIDSDLDPSMKVTLNGPFSMTSNFFRRCITERNTAIVRYHYLKFPASGVEFTRYVPNADQQTLYDPNWQDVNIATLDTSLACATYAQTNNTAMMYQFVGSECRVSTIRMAVRVPTCGGRNVNAVFIRTSCPEPTILGLTLTPDAGAMNITWTVNDPCNVSGGFQVKWVNDRNMDVAALNINVFHYRITDLFGCETQNVTVTAVDSISLPWGNLSLASADTLSRGSPVMTTLTVHESVTFIHVSWTSDFNECLRINNYVMTWDSNTETLGQNVFEYNITGLNECQDITVTVKALYDNGSKTSNILSKLARTLPEGYCGPMTAVVGEMRRLTSHTSYNGVTKYVNYMDVGFLLESPWVGTHVRIQFQAFDIENKFDTLKIFDGSTSSDPLLANLTGNLEANLPTYTSTGRYLVLVFHTDFSVVKTGWLLLYDVV